MARREAAEGLGHLLAVEHVEACRRRIDEVHQILGDENPKKTGNDAGNDAEYLSQDGAPLTSPAAAL